MEQRENKNLRNLFLPQFPKIPERYGFIKVRDGEYRLYSLTKSLTLREDTSTGLLVRFLPLLDGQHKLEEILQQLPEFDTETLLEVLTQLKDQGILENATVELPPTLERAEIDRYKDQLTFFSHFSVDWEAFEGSDMDSPKNQFVFQEKLKQAKVVLFGLGRAGSNLLRMLTQVGVGKLIGVDSGKVEHKDFAVDTWFSEENLNQFRVDVLQSKIQTVNPHAHFEGVSREVNSRQEIIEVLKGCSLAIVSMDHFNPGFYEVFNQACLEEKITWTSYRLFGFEVNIGPTVIPYETPCYKCFDLRRKGNLTFYEEYTLLERYLKEHQFPSGYLYITPGIGLAVLEVIKLLTRFVDPATYGKFFSVNLLTLETRLHSILKLPQCPHCGRPAKGRPTIHIWDSKET